MAWRYSIRRVERVFLFCSYTGWGGSADSFFPVFNFLKAYFEVYAIDFPGFGRSSLPREVWGVEDYSELVYSFLKELKIDRVYVIAHSFGGRVAIVLASSYPELVGKLVLVNSAGLIPKRRLNYYLKVYSFKLLKRLFLLLGMDLTPLYRIWGSKDYREAGPLRPIFVRVVNQDLRNHLPLIRCPTLLVWGDEDRETPLYFGEIMEREIPKAKLFVFKGAGHFSYLERLDEFNKMVLEFLKGGTQS